MPTRIDADLAVQRFGFAAEPDAKRLLFPHADARDVTGRTGSVAYGGGELGFDELEGRIDQLQWKAGTASISKAWLRDDGGRVDLAADRLDFPRGLRLVRAEKGIEILSRHVTISDLALTIKGPFSRSSSEAAPATALRQERFRFLDSLSGRIYVTVKVALDLPVLGIRTLDQELKVPVQEGSIDYRALDDSLNWLEGQFLDFKHSDDELALTWRVPVVGSKHELITWTLDHDASALAAFGRVPVRSLIDFRFAPPKEDTKKKNRQIVQAFALDAIDVALSLLAPRSLDVAGGVILFGGEDQPGMVDLEVSGAIHDAGPGALRGKIGSLDTTIKDLKAGPVTVTADRLCFDGIDKIEVEFDGFKPVQATLHVHRVTGTNVALRIG
jgi:hypothetical protein